MVYNHFKKEDLTWISENPDKWIDYETYLNLEQIARNIVCTNDVAEGAIKLVQDFKTTAKRRKQSKIFCNPSTHIEKGQETLRGMRKI